MSAYIVSKNHIIYLITAAMSRRLNAGHGHFSWCFPDDTQPDGFQRRELFDTSHGDEIAADAANMLWRENIASVSHRYPGESSATLPGPIGGDFVITRRHFQHTVFNEIDPVQVLKSCDCYEYQSCEHPGWENSEAKAFIKALRNHAIRALPGYEDAAWGEPETEKAETLKG